MTCSVPEPCKFPSLDSCQKRFLWTYKEVDFALHPVVGQLGARLGAFLVPIIKEPTSVCGTHASTLDSVLCIQR